MVEIQLKFDKGVPQYACNACSNCSSIHGKSLCSIKNRGCCWYFPKITLHEIHKMSKNNEGLEILQNVLRIPEIKIYNYYIHVKGYFDEAGLKKHLESGHAPLLNVEDESIFFRACHFVNPGIGCTLPGKYRSHICNFYICDEIYKEAEEYSEFKYYKKERNSYVKWISIENYSLEMLLKEKGVNLLENFDDVVDILKDISLDNYEFPDLPIIKIENDYSIGA